MERDPLTGVYSRETLDACLQAEVRRAEACESSLALLIIDLDYLKSVNDAFGHTRGDEVLTELVARLTRAVRGTDLIFRYGGDEFVLLLRDTGPDRALALTKRLLESVRAHPFEGEPPLSVTLSIGFACYPTDGAAGRDLFAAADARLRQAKREGRARIVGHQGVVPDAGPVELSRLIQRDAALEALHGFLDALETGSRGLLRVTGPAGGGISRFLLEAGRAASLRGYTVVALSGSRGPDGFPADGRLDPEAPGVLVTVDVAGPLGAETERQLWALLRASRGGRVGIAWGGREAPPMGIASVPLVREVKLAPLSQDGVRVWVRSVLGWEPPPQFLAWLVAETEGLPVRLEQRLGELVRSGALRRESGAWSLNLEIVPASPETVPGGAAPGPRLPVVLTRFVGREAETRRILSLLGRARLTTLLGPSGIGKTRLALHVAAYAGRIADRILFLPLAPVTDREGVLAAVAAALGAKSDAPPLDAIAAAGGEGATLLVLDNLEQIRDAGAVVGDLLRAAPGLRVLATSRTALRIYGESVFPVPPLPVPDAGATRPAVLRRNPAVALFVDRASEVSPEFELTAENAAAVAELCRRFEGVPLALELAAARTRLLQPEEQLARMEGRLALMTSGAEGLPSRSQTLRDAIDSTYELLGPGDRQLFHRLALFPAGATLEAAEEVCAELSTTPGGVRRDEVMAALTTLIEHSLVRQVQGMDGRSRCAMLETIREYAFAGLAAFGEDRALRPRLIGYYLSLAERAEPELRGGRQAAWLRRLDAEHENLRAAIQAAREEQEPLLLLRFCGALWRFWFTRGYRDEGRAWMDAALSAPVGELTDDLRGARGKTLYGLGVLHMAQGDWEGAGRVLEEALELYRGIDDPLGTANVLNSLGILEYCLGEYGRSRRRHDEALALRRAAGDPWGIAASLHNLGEVALAEGDYHAARALNEEALVRFRDLDDDWNIGATLLNLGATSLSGGDLAHAEELFLQAVAVYHSLGDPVSLAGVFDELAVIAERRGFLERAVVLGAGAQGLRDSIRAPLPSSATPYRPTPRLLEEGRRAASGEFAALWRQGTEMTADQLVEYACGRDPQSIWQTRHAAALP
jgi:diguanylate cyclase (GGDEF)-like protein